MGHFYSKEGVPHFDVTPKKAQEMGLLWSVTEIQRVEHSEGLKQWAINTAIQACADNPQHMDEPFDAYKKRIRGCMYGDNSSLQLGTDIHDAIERVLARGVDLGDITDRLQPFVTPAVNYFMEKGFEVLEVEKIVVNLEEGYAGTADMIARSKKNQDFILDWKSTGNIPSTPYPNQIEQISAYAVAQFGKERVMDGEIWGANAYIHQEELYKRGDKKGQAKFKVHAYEPKELANAYERFLKVIALWRCRSGYDPRKLYQSS